MLWIFVGPLLYLEMHLSLYGYPKRNHISEYVAHFDGEQGGEGEPPSAEVVNASGDEKNKEMNYGTNCGF